MTRHRRVRLHVPSDGPAEAGRRTLGAVSNDSDDKRTDSGIVVRPLYTADDLAGWDAAAQLGTPGTPPYTRGVYPTMYRGKLWTMRQYAGFGTAASTNERFKFLLEAGQTGLSCAFDLPTQMGYDSDHPRAEGEVGKVGVAIDSHRRHAHRCSAVCRSTRSAPR